MTALATYYTISESSSGTLVLESCRERLGRDKEERYLLFISTVARVIRSRSPRLEVTRYHRRIDDKCWHHY